MGKIRVHIYIDLENIQDAWLFIKHLKGKHQKAFIISSNVAKIKLEVPLHEIQKINPKQIKAIILNRNKYTSEGVCDVRLLSELMDNIKKADIHIIVSKDQGYKAFTDFNKKCNNPNRKVLQISTDRELLDILKNVNEENKKIELEKAEENKPITPDTVAKEWVEPTTNKNKTFILPGS